jgi:hypothetical protein
MAPAAAASPQEDRTRGAEDRSRRGKTVVIRGIIRPASRRSRAAREAIASRR